MAYTGNSNTKDVERGYGIHPYERKYSRNGLSKFSKIPEGYSQAATFINLNEDAAIFRRFGEGHARLLLTQQAELVDLENQLLAIDKIEQARLQAQQGSVDGGYPAPNKTWIDHQNAERVAILEKYRFKLRQYDEDLLVYRQILALPKAKRWQIENFWNWMSREVPFDMAEGKFLSDPDDVIALRREPEDAIRLSDTISNFLLRTFGPCLYIFHKKNKDVIADDKNYITYSKTALDLVGRFLFGVISAGFVTAGVIALYFAHTNDGRLEILAIATIICAVLMSVLTNAKKGEIFAATAAYCAVLVVFVGQTLGNGIGGCDNGPSSANNHPVHG